ncbi:MAG: hypothetical protein JXB48_17875 [Candidatus Latescibacteria bacterium]|nr:hypothetical protein [Candidatus Latescibacterota bacterium]
MDNHLIDSMQNTRLKLHEPKQTGVAILFDKPWEGAFCGYATVLRDNDVYKIYYRGLPLAGADGSTNEVTCYAESRDGITWEKPNLGLFEVHGTTDNNVILSNEAPFSHNFAPFIDTKPGVPQSERYKALAGTSKSGLVAFISPDGVRWKKMREEPLITEGAFDSQNVVFWSETENCYICYFRTWTSGEFKGYRTISRATSKDFRTWTKPVQMDFGDTPIEHLYTNQTTPYFRAPHIYIAIPMRFMPGRKVLTDEQALELGVNPKYKSDCAEAVLMTSRGGSHYDRTFMEGFIRPGTDIGNWASRAGMTACGIVPTGPAEISLYKQAHYAQPSTHLLRFTLRTDGFVSVNASYSGGEMTTKSLKFKGNKLILNFSTSAAGGIKVEILDSSGKVIPGYSIDDCDEIIGDSIERTVTWNNNSDVSRLAGQPVRLRFTMKDADVFSMRFR